MHSRTHQANILSCKYVLRQDPNITRSVETHSLAALVGSVGLVHATLERLFTLRSACCDGTGINAFGELAFKTGTAFERTLGIRSATPGVAIEKLVEAGNSDTCIFVKQAIQNSNVEGGGPIASMHDVNKKHFPWAAWQEGRWWLLGVGSRVPCLSSKLGEMPSKLAFEWSCASKIRSAHESINK